ncbi:MAG: heme-binding protein [Oscillospiraceae bacterium]|nr:heme-binding protein [Oscillospiraceae bacterium]
MKSIDEMLDAVAKNMQAAPPAKNIHIKKSSEKSPAAVKAPEKTDKIKSLPEYDSLTLSLAKEIAYAVEKAAEQLGVSVVTAVVNEGTNLVLLHAMDDSYIASVRAAQDKAYTAAALKMPTDAALRESRGGSLDGFTNGNGILLLGGGEPLMKGKRLFGAVGVSGGTKEQDILLSRLGERYFRARIK